MYCRRCGNKMGDMDRFCHACGAPAAYQETPSEPAGSAEINEEIIFNPPYGNSSHYSESELRFAEERASGPDSAEGNLQNGIVRGDIEEDGKNELRTEEATGTRGTGKTERTRDNEFIWNVHEFPKAFRKTDEIEFNWNMDEYSSQEEKAEEAKSLEEVLFKEMEDDSRRLRENNIDRFFTFSRKNEEFQELLDKEYEKLRSRTGLMRGPVVGEAAPETEKEPALHKTSAGQDVSTTEPTGETARIEPAEMEKVKVAETEAPGQAEAGSQDQPGSQDQAGSQAEAVSETEAVSGQAGEKPGAEPAVETLSAEETEQAVETLSAEEAASSGEEAAFEAVVADKRKAEPAGGSEESAEGIFEGLSANEPEKPAEAEHEEKNARIFEDLTEEPASETEPASTTNEAGPVIIPAGAADTVSTTKPANEAEPAGATDTASKTNEAEQAGTTKPASAVESPDVKEPPDAKESSGGSESAIAEELTERARAWEEEREPEALSRLLTFSHDKHDAADDLEARIQEAFATDEREDEQKQKRSAWTILFTVIAVILAIEIVILGIRYFAPDSAAADAVNNAQTKVVRTVSGWVDGIKELFSGNDSGEGTITPDDGESGDNQTGDAGENKPGEEEDGKGTGADLPDPNPAADKNALISSELGNNVNIGQVKANDALAWQQGKDYGIADVNNSKPIENNVWQTPENGEPVYYDRSIVGAVIAFDSRWIDFVNGGNKSVLDLLKKDSEAYRKAANFSGVGKIKETFELLEIGEIRQGTKGFYVWTHEEIKVTEGGKTKDKKYNWIYYLEPVEGKMKIVNYFRF